MNCDEPLVSICIPCYNAEKTIAATLDSILTQTYTNIEIIVSDNQSTDKTRDVVRSYESKGVKLVENPPVVEGDGRIFGAFDNWDYALSQGKGEFLCLYHADDLYDSEIVEKEVCFLLSNDDVGAVVTLQRNIDEEGQAMASQTISPLACDKFLDFSSFMELLLEYGHFVSTPTLMLKKETVTKLGGFCEDAFSSAADLDYLIRAAVEVNLGVINERLHTYRISKTHISSIVNHMRIERADYFTVMDFYIHLYGRENITARLLKSYRWYLKKDLLRCLYHAFCLGRGKRLIKLCTQLLK